MTNRLLAGLFGLALAVADPDASRAQSAASPKPAATTRIRVLDSATGQAIPSASINQTELGSGRYLVTVQSPQHQSMSGEILLAQNSPYSFRFLLDPLGEPREFRADYLAALRRDDATLIVGFVVDDEGEPLPRVHVSSSPSGVTDVTDRRGFFRLLVPVQSPAEARTNPANLLFERAGYQTHERLRLELTPGGDWEYAITLNRGNGWQTVDETSLRHRSPDATLGPEPSAAESIPVGVPAELSKIPTPNATAASNSTVRVPRNIRVLQANGTNIDYVTLDYYTRHVLPAEWIAGWGSPTTYPGGSNSLSAGAVAVRCYAIAKLNSATSASAYDICATTSCQVYNPATSSSFTDTAVNYTANWVLIGAGGAIASTEYSAEDNSLGFSCGDGFTQPTGGCTYDPVCAGEPRNGHGRGMCQWGSAKWATGRKFAGNTTANTATNGYPRRDWTWIVQHYYPTLTLVKGAPLMVGDDVKALTTLNVRACPDGSITNGVNCALVTTKGPGSTGAILGGPMQITADANGTNSPGGFTWYQVQWSDTTVGWSAENYLERVFSLPSAPNTLAAVAAGTNQINLSWTDTSGGVAAGFKLERSISSGGPWLQLSNTLAPIVAYADKNLPTASTWYYRARAYNAAGNSGYSSVASATTSNPPPILQPIANKTITEGSPLSFTNAAAGPDFAQLITDFEPFTTEISNGIVLFRTPRFSGSTSGFLDATPDLTVITDLFATNANPSSRALRVTCNFTNSANPWLRLTTASAANFPNPVVDFTKRLRFSLYADKPVQVAIGCRETTVPAGAPIGSDGGSSGGIEWVGVTNISGTAPMPARTVTASNWTVLTFDPANEEIRNFAGGNGVLSTASGLGTLEHIAIVPAAGTGIYNLFLDNFAVVTPRTFTYGLAPGAPANASINPATGVFSWTPTEAQGPGTFPFSIIATDNSNPPLSTTNSFTVFVLETNAPPVLAAIADRIVHGGVVIQFTNAASDPDLPANILTYSLDSGAPPTASVGASSGIFHWLTTDSDADTVNPISVRVTDDGVPPRNDVQSFVVTVHPKPTIQSVTSGGGHNTLTWSAIIATRYRVQFKDDLADPGWTDLAPDVTAIGPAAAFTDNFGAPQRFYRVLVLD